MTQELPLGWECISLLDNFDVYQPKTISSNDLQEDGKYFAFGANGLIGRYYEYNHEHVEVVMTCRGASCGNVHKTPAFSWITGNAMVIKPKGEFIDQDYLYFSLKTAPKAEVISGSAQPQITRQSLSSLRLPLPPLNEQRRWYHSQHCNSSSVMPGLRARKASVKQTASGPHKMMLFMFLCYLGKKEPTLHELA